jgi:hypothetical protein
MNLAAIFVIICGLFVAVVLGLVLLLIIRGLGREADHQSVQRDSRKKAA